MQLEHYHIKQLNVQGKYVSLLVTNHAVKGTKILKINTYIPISHSKKFQEVSGHFIFPHHPKDNSKIVVNANLSFPCPKKIQVQEEKK